MSEPAPVEPAPLDFAAWRPILTGLNLMHGTLVVFLWAAIIEFAAMFLMFHLVIMHDVRWIGFVWLAIAIAIFLFTAGFLLLGMGLCCLAPNETGGKRYAQAAFVLSLTATTLGILWLALEYLVLPNVSQQLFNEITRFDHGLWILKIVFMLNVTLAVATWHRFLQTIARVFNSAYADATEHFLVCFCVWAAVFTLVICIDPGYVLWLNVVRAAVGLVALFAAAPLGIWSVVLLFEVRDIVRKALLREPASPAH